MAPRQFTGCALPALVQAHAARQPDAFAILAPSRSPLTYAGLWNQMLRVAGTLQAQGVTPTTRVAVMLGNGPELATAFLGVAACAASVPLNPAHRAEELRHHLESARVRVIVVGAEESGPVHAVAKGLGLTVIGIDVDTNLPAGQFAAGAAPQDGAAVRLQCTPGDVALAAADLRHDGAAEARAIEPREPGRVGVQHRRPPGLAAGGSLPERDAAVPHPRARRRPAGFGGGRRQHRLRAGLRRRVPSSTGSRSFEPELVHRRPDHPSGGGRRACTLSAKALRGTASVSCVRRRRRCRRRPSRRCGRCSMPPSWKRTA